MWDHPKKLKNRDKCPRPKKVPLGQSGQHFRLFPKNLQTLEFCLLLEVYSKLFWSKIINQELISLWGPIIDASRILLNEWKNERGLNHYWMKVVNYGWQYSKEHPPLLFSWRNLMSKKQAMKLLYVVVNDLTQK